MFPYKEIIKEIQSYIGLSLSNYSSRIPFGSAIWHEQCNKLCGDWGRNNGLFQENDINYQSYLRDCKFKGIPLATYDFDFIRSLLDLIHLTHRPNPNDPYYSNPSECSWIRKPLAMALSWLKWIYQYYPDVCKELVKEYRDNNKMIPDNIDVGYEVWADSVLAVKKTKHKSREIKTMIDKIKKHPSFSYMRYQARLIDDDLIWSGSQADLSRWLRGIPIKGQEKQYKPIIERKWGNKWNWVSVNGIFRYSADGNYLTNKDLCDTSTTSH